MGFWEICLQKRLKDMPLRHQFMVTVLVLVIVIMLLFGVVRIKAVVDNNRDELQVKIDTMTSLAAMGYSDPLWNYNYEGMEAIGNALLQDKEIGLVLLQLDDGSEVYSKEKQDFAYIRSNLIINSAPVQHNNTYLGKITIGVTPYYRNDFVRKELIGTVIVLIVMAIILSLIIQRVSCLVTKPLHELSLGADEIAKGNLEKRLELDVGGEIGELAQRFNSMAEHLGHMIQERDKWFQALKNANNELEMKVEFRTTELTALNQELITTNTELQKALDELKETQDYLIHSEKMAALGNLVAGVAHEINTPIGIGVTLASHLDLICQEFAKLCEQKAVKEPDLNNFIEECCEASKMILNNLQRAARLVSSFKQVSVDQSIETRRIFNVAQYFEEILISLQPKLKKTKQVIKFECDKGLEIDGYPGALYQILTNLIMNSLNHAFTPEMTGNIVIYTTRNEHSFSIIYSDNGKGMEKNVLSRIFEPFFTTKRGNGGTGLGLYIVYNIVVEQLGGTVECWSEPNKGVRFTINIPLNRSTCPIEETDPRNF